MRLSVQEFLWQHHLDTAMVSDTTAFHLRLENLKTPYTQRIDTCQSLVDRLSRVAEGLRQGGELRDSLWWIDSATCYVDYLHFAPLIDTCLEKAKELVLRYQELERQRLEAERRAAEERARQEAKRHQDSLNANLRRLKDQVNDQNSQIESICAAIGVSDKKKQKTLGDIRFDYRHIFNRYDLTVTQGSVEENERLQRLANFQRHLLDSVLGPSSYPSQIEDFPTVLKLHTGKSHTEVYKSYLRVFKTVVIPKSFGRLEDYRPFVQRLREVRAVQEGYIETIHLREEIANNSISIQNKCDKKYKEINESYQTVLQGVNQIPAFSTIGEMEMFFESLHNFIEVQQQYLISIDRLDIIQTRGDSILDLCHKKIADVADSYKRLVGSSLLSPTYKTLEGAEFFNNYLTDFEQLQQDYITTISLRNTILAKGDSIRLFKGAPRILTSSFKDVFSHTVLIPNFNNGEKAAAYLQSLQDLIALEDLYLESERVDRQLQSTAQTIKSLYKVAPHLVKAYGKAFDDLAEMSTIRDSNDLKRYREQQQQQQLLQERVLSIIHSLDRDTYNDKLKGVSNVVEIKGILGFYN